MTRPPVDPAVRRRQRRLVVGIVVFATVFPFVCAGAPLLLLREAAATSNAAHEAWRDRLTSCAGLVELVGAPVREVGWRTVGVGHRSFRRWAEIEVELEGPRDRVRVQAETQGLDPATPVQARIARPDGLPLVLDDAFCASGSRWPDASPGGPP